MGQYGRELDPRLRHHRERSAEKRRPGLLRPKDEAGEKRNEMLQGRRILIRGRFNASGREVWDVLEVIGGKATIYAADIPFEGEAIEVAMACKRGKLTVRLGFTRTEMSVTKGGLLTPSSSVEVPKRRPLKRIDSNTLELK